jgi:hypothetical protein
MIGLEHKLEQMSERLKEISKEIEHARKQEIAMKQSSGEYVHSQIIHVVCPPDDQSLSTFRVNIVQRAVVQHSVHHHFGLY